MFMIRWSHMLSPRRQAEDPENPPVGFVSANIYHVTDAGVR